MRRTVIVSLMAALAIMAASVAPAGAQDENQEQEGRPLTVTERIIRDCYHNGRLTQAWSIKDLKKALKRLPDDINEYSDCEDILKAAISQASGGHGGDGAYLPPGGSSGPFATPIPQIAPTPEDVAALADASHRGKDPVGLGGKDVAAGSAGPRDSSLGKAVPILADAFTRSLPVPSWLVLGILGSVSVAVLWPSAARGTNWIRFRLRRR